MEKAKDYFDREYDGNHIATVVDMFDLKSLYGLMEEYAEAVKKLSIHNVVGQSEQLKALEDLKDFAYDNCQPHNSDRLAEIMERL